MSRLVRSSHISFNRPLFRRIDPDALNICVDCGKVTDNEPHGCPFEAGRHGNNRRDFCNCCSTCTKICVDELEFLGAKT